MEILIATAAVAACLYAIYRDIEWERRRPFGWPFGRISEEEFEKIICSNPRNL